MVEDKPLEGKGCQVTEIFQILSRAHMLDLLHLFTVEADEPVRFNQIEEALDVSPNTLSKRLKEMVQVGLVERQSYQEIPPRVEYEATQKARDLVPVFVELDRWTDEHSLREELEAQAPS